MNTPTPSQRETPRDRLLRFEFIALMAALMSLNALAIDVMLPALPNIGEALGVTNENDRPLILTVYLLGVGVATLVFGPLADRFGRRGPLLIGISIYVIAAVAAVLAPSFTALLIFRFVQGLGAAAFRVVALAVVRDKFEGRAMAEIMSLTFMVLMIVPIIAPGIGQLILFVVPWQGIFLFVGFFGAAVWVWSYFRLSETLDPKDRRPLTVSGVLGGFAIVISNRFAMLYALAGMVIFGALMGMINSSQQIYVGIYGLGPLFPVAFAGMAGMMAVASFLNSRIVGRFGMRRISHFGLVIFTLSSALLALISILGDVPFWVFFVLLSIALFMFSWIVSNLNSLAMEPLGRIAGTAASAFGFFQTLGGTLIGLMIGRYFNGTVTPIALGFAVLGLVSLGLVMWAEDGKLFGTGEYPTDQANRPS